MRVAALIRAADEAGPYRDADRYRAFGVWFPVAEELYRRGAEIPDRWQYRPGLAGPEPADGDVAYWLDSLTDDQLRAAGNLLARYIRRVDFVKGPG